MRHPSDTTTLIFIIQLGLLMVVGRFMGELMQRVRQPAVMGQLIAGVLLGPSVLGAIWPTAYHTVFPQPRCCKRTRSVHSCSSVPELA